jgi:hypothetical protein
MLTTGLEAARGATHQSCYDVSPDNMLLQGASVRRSAEVFAVLPDLLLYVTRVRAG